MAKHNAIHPGVKVYLKGTTFCIRFRQKGHDKRKSLATADAKIADEYATTVYKILDGQPYDYAKTPELIKRILGLQNPEHKDIDTILEKLGSHLDDDGEDDPKKDAILGDLIVADHEIENLKRDLQNSQIDNEQLRMRVAALESILAATGRAQLRKLGPKTLESAITGFIAHGTGAEERTRDEYTNYLNSFVAKIGKDKDLSKIDPDEVIEYLTETKSKITYVPTVRKICSIIVSMLEHQTGGLYPVRPIKEWRKRFCKTEGKIDNDFYWLLEPDVFRLAKAILKAHGQYWRDCALIQFALALRPEELILLQGKEVDFKSQSIHITPLTDDGGKIVRRLKTRNSKATLNFPDYVRSILKRRVKQGAVLFPRDAKELKLRAENRGSPFELAHRLWQPKAFCKHYLSVLRDSS